jgi:medium-chain acyl-[acyl-carrier-protein] hydrolase
MILNNPWIICPKLNPLARLRLFCFPHAGKGASVFIPWSKGVPAEVELCAIQLPGRETRLREKPFARIAPLVQVLKGILQPAFSLPFAFFGHSMGALIAFELVRELRKQNEPTPFHLFVSARRAPQIPEPHPPVSHLPDSEFIEEVQHRFDGIPEAILRDAELLPLLLPGLRADFEIVESYHYRQEPPMDCPITAFGGFQDSDTLPLELEAWQAQTLHRFRMKMFSGNHFFLQSAQTELLQAVSAELTTAISQVPKEGKR